MKKMVLFLSIVLLTPQLVYSAPDYYLGDTSVYAGSTVNVPPNIMLLFDVSNTLTRDGTVLSYDPSIDYTQKYLDETTINSKYNKDGIYVLLAETGGTVNYKEVLKISDLNCEEALSSFNENGTWSKDGYILSDKKSNLGQCVSGDGEVYFLGNYLCMQHEYANIPPDEWESGIDYKIGDIVKATIDGKEYKFSCSLAHISDSESIPNWGGIVGGTETDVHWKIAKSAIAVAIDVLGRIANGFKDRVRLGVALIGSTANKGADIYLHFDDNNDIASKTAIIKDASVAGNHQPISDGLWDIGTYYSDKYEFISTYTDNIPDEKVAKYWCQSNNIVLVTSDYLSDELSAPIKEYVEDEYGDGSSTPQYVSKYLYEKIIPKDLDSTFAGTHNK